MVSRVDYDEPLSAIARFHRDRPFLKTFSASLYASSPLDSCFTSITEGERRRLLSFHRLPLPVKLLFSTGRRMDSGSRKNNILPLLFFFFSRTILRRRRNELLLHRFRSTSRVPMNSYGTFLFPRNQFRLVDFHFYFSLPETFPLFPPLFFPGKQELFSAGRRFYENIRNDREKFQFPKWS